MTRLVILLKKELLDAQRDRRAVMAGLYYALGTPIVICLLFTLLIGQITQSETLKISITNSKLAPDLISFLANSQIIHADSTDEQLKPIQLIISKDYAANMAKGKPASVTIEVDTSDEKLAGSINKLQTSLQSYSSQIAQLRLLARGINPEVIQSIKLTLHNQASPSSQGGFILGIAIFTMMFAVFISGMNLAIDTSAGERERNSLALLLSHPVKTWELVGAKVLAVTVFALFGLILIMLNSKLAYSFVPWQELGFSVELSVPFLSLMLLLSIPVALLAASLQIFVSFMAKTFKEAQSYLTLVLILPMGIAMMANYRIAPEILQWLPISGQQQALMAFIKDQPISFLQLGTASFITLILAMIFILGLGRMLKSEKVIFGL